MGTEDNPAYAVSVKHNKSSKCNDYTTSEAQEETLYEIASSFQLQ